MLLKTDHDAIEKVRSHPGVREVIEAYRKYVNAPDDAKKLWKFFTRMHVGKRYNFESDVLIVVMAMIGKAYREVTGKSPLTTDPITNTRPFYGFAQELFNREDLDPPTQYKIRKATEQSTNNSYALRDRFLRGTGSTSSTDIALNPNLRSSTFRAARNVRMLSSPSLTCNVTVKMLIRDRGLAQSAATNPSGDPAIPIPAQTDRTR